MAWTSPGADLLKLQHRAAAGQPHVRHRQAAPAVERGELVRPAAARPPPTQVTAPLATTLDEQYKDALDHQTRLQ